MLILLLFHKRENFFHSYEFLEWKIVKKIKQIINSNDDDCLTTWMRHFLKLKRVGIWEKLLMLLAVLCAFAWNGNFLLFHMRGEWMLNVRRTLRLSEYTEPNVRWETFSTLFGKHKKASNKAATWQIACKISCCLKFNAWNMALALKIPLSQLKTYLPRHLTPTLQMHDAAIRCYSFHMCLISRMHFINFISLLSLQIMYENSHVGSFSTEHSIWMKSETCSMSVLCKSTLIMKLILSSFCVFTLCWY